MQTLKELFKRLKAANFVARPTKCVYGTTQVDFLGRCLDKGMIGLQDVKCPEDEGRPKHRRFTKDWCGVDLRNDLTIH